MNNVDWDIKSWLCTAFQEKLQKQKLLRVEFRQDVDEGTITYKATRKQQMGMNIHLSILCMLQFGLLKVVK